MKLLREYFGLQATIYSHFGYVEDWVIIPLQDATQYHWCLRQNKDGTGKVWYSNDPMTASSVADGERLYSVNIYTQRFLPKWVYRAHDCTMICVDTRTDGNKFLMVFDNEKELKSPSPEIISAFRKWDKCVMQ